MKKKVGIIVEGGGMKCAYGAGVLDVFLDEGFDKYIDYGVGVSAGAANLASFEAGQRDRNRRYYVIHSQDPRYFSVSNFFKTGSLFGLRYIYADMTNEGGGDPLDYDALISNPMEMWLPATDAVSGKPVYFRKQDMKRNSYEPIMASCCLPVACKAIEYEGHYYYDGGVTDSIPVRKALADGCEKIIYVSSKPYDFVKEPESFKHMYRLLLGRKFKKLSDALDRRHINYNESLEIIHKMEKEGNCIGFYVPKDIKIGTYTTDPAIMQQLYDAGVKDAKAKATDLKEFLEI